VSNIRYTDSEEPNCNWKTDGSLTLYNQLGGDLAIDYKIFDYIPKGET
jgi:hypothetical protein